MSERNRSRHYTPDLVIRDVFPTDWSPSSTILVRFNGPLELKSAFDGEAIGMLGRGKVRSTTTSPDGELEDITLNIQVTDPVDYISSLISYHYLISSRRVEVAQLDEYVGAETIQRD